MSDGEIVKGDLLVERGDNDLCTCGHERQQHYYAIDFLFCQSKGCKCLTFKLAQLEEEVQTKLVGGLKWREKK